MNINWNAAGAVAAALTVLFAVLRWILPQFRTTISYSRTVICGKIPEEVDNDYFIRDICAERFTIKNRGFKNLKDVSMRIDNVTGVWSKKISKCSSIDPVSIIVLIEEGSVIITIADFPRYEEVHFDLMSNDSDSYFREIRGGGSEYRVLSFDDYLFRLISAFILPLSIAGIVLGIVGLKE